jgi:hypothetical protein
MFVTLFGHIVSLENIVPFRSKRVATCLRRKRVEVTNFSTWEVPILRLTSKFAQSKLWLQYKIPLNTIPDVSPTAVLLWILTL